MIFKLPYKCRSERSEDLDQFSSDPSHDNEQRCFASLNMTALFAA